MVRICSVNSQVVPISVVFSIGEGKLSVPPASLSFPLSLSLFCPYSSGRMHQYFLGTFPWEREIAFPNGNVPSGNASRHFVMHEAMGTFPLFWERFVGAFLVYDGRKQKYSKIWNSIWSIFGIYSGYEDIQCQIFVRKYVLLKVWVSNQKLKVDDW